MIISVRLWKQIVISYARNSSDFFKCLSIFIGAALQAYSKAQSHHTVQPKAKKVRFFKEEGKFLLFYELEYTNTMLLAPICQV